MSSDSETSNQHEVKNPRVDLQGKTYSFFTHKGGVGKTLFSVNLSMMLCSRGKRVCIIDLDPQMNTTNCLLTDHEWDSHIRELDKYLSDQKYAAPVKNSWISITKSNFNHFSPHKVNIDITNPANLNVNRELFLIKGSFEDTKFVSSLSSDISNDQTVYVTLINDFLKKLQMDYHYVIVDLSPSFNDLNKTIVYASKNVICPITPDDFCALTPKLILWNITHASQKTAFAEKKVNFSHYIMNLCKTINLSQDKFSRITQKVRDKFDLNRMILNNDDNKSLFELNQLRPTINFPNMLSPYSEIMQHRLNIVTSFDFISNGVPKKLLVNEGDGTEETKIYVPLSKYAKNIKKWRRKIVELSNIIFELNVDNAENDSESEE